MATVRDLPYGNSQFVVEIDTIARSNFEQVLLPNLEIEVEEYREGGDPRRTARKLPGQPLMTNLVLRRGFCGSLDLYNWWLQAADQGNDARRGVRVVLQDEERNPVASWNIRDAFPVNYSFSPLDALDGSPLVESIELAFDRITME